MKNQHDYIYGIHAIDAVLTHQPERMLELFMQPKRNARLAGIEQLAKSLGIKIQTMDVNALSKKARSEQHQGAVALCYEKTMLTEHELEAVLQSKAEEPKLVLMLDKVQDPHNLGACLRVAQASGVDAVVVGKHHNTRLTGVVCKVAAGAAETLPVIRATNLKRVVDALKKQSFWVYGATDKAAQTVYETKYPDNVVLVMGNEGEGVSQSLLASCDQQISIPMLGSVASLNLSVATGVCLYEVVRQRSYASQ